MIDQSIIEEFRVLCDLVHLGQIIIKNPETCSEHLDVFHTELISQREKWEKNLRQKNLLVEIQIQPLHTNGENEDSSQSHHGAINTSTHTDQRSVTRGCPTTGHILSVLREEAESDTVRPRTPRPDTANARDVYSVYVTKDDGTIIWLQETV